MIITHITRAARFAFGLSLCALMLAPATSHAQGTLLDDFESLDGWEAHPSDGVTMNLAQVPGHRGKGMAIAFGFTAGSGYAIARKKFPLTLPSNYKFTFWLRGETPANNFELKLIDSVDNVYWIKKLNVTYPTAWTPTTVKKRHLSFAWGPAGGGMIRRVTAIEFVVSAGTGGTGRIMLDDFRLEPMEDPGPFGPPSVSASSRTADGAASFATDDDRLSAWRSDPSDVHPWYLLDFTRVREFGGLVIDWDRDDYGKQYSVELSENGRDWSTAYRVTGGNGGRDYIPLPEADARMVRLNCGTSSRGKEYAIRNILIQPVEWSESPNALFTSIAGEAPRGLYPRYLRHEQSFWTVVGVSGDTKEALLNEEGMIEVDKGGFSLEPFVYEDGRLITWTDVTTTHTLRKEYLPIPSTHWHARDFILDITACASGEPGRSSLVASYRLTNTGPAQRRMSLFIAIRPFQVLPPWQSLNIIGGVSPIGHLESDGKAVKVNHQKYVIPLPRPDGFGAASFDEGGAIEYLRDGSLPPGTVASDEAGYASGAFRYDMTLRPGTAQNVAMVVPFHGVPTDVDPMMSPVAVDTFVKTRMAATEQFWEHKLANIEIRLPRSARKIIDVFKSTLAYILINRDGPAIQPGSRTYERAWIRDGALTSAAILRTGNQSEVREYLDWYAPHQYPNGKIPCVVDTRGADPVPENDSHGEFIYAVLQYFRFTGDTTWLRGKFDHVRKAADYIESLRDERKTDRYEHGAPQERALFGLLPESISHEGYSAKPMHSYWDDFFGVRGLKDAATIAAILGDADLHRKYAAAVDDFRICLYSSMRLAMQNTGVDYIPGCAELGDFDATSTAIGIDPCGELGLIPEPQLTHTFDQYFRFFRDRRDNVISWENYTPYEVRLIGSFIRLGRKDRAHQLLRYFLHDQRPAGWNHWAEVVWRDSLTPKMIGDMPHTWVGSDYMRSVSSMFAYERERDGAMIIGAGIPEEWLDEGVEIKRLATCYGTLNISYIRERGAVRVKLQGSSDVPPGGFVVMSPPYRPVKSVIVNGKASKFLTADAAVVTSFPADIIFRY